MSIALDRTERRVVGSLVEKDLSVPETYPLTLNALVLACNQKSNRDPEMELAEHEVYGALRALMDRGWVVEMELAGARTKRYAHRAREQLAVDDADLAILAELLLRGPQSPPELRTRASRMRPLSDADEVEARLRRLAERPVPYVRFVGRRTGERVPRCEHTLAPAGEAPSGDAASAPSAGPAPAPRATPLAPAAATPSAHAPSVADLLARIERLEAEVEALRRRVGD